MARKPWHQMSQEERDAANRRSELITKVIAGLIVFLIFAVIISITLVIRYAAPCWVFPLKEAPSRCLVVTPR